MNPKNLPKCLRKFAPKIESISDERPDDGYWVYLLKGWRDPEGETHCIHEDTLQACVEHLYYITQCTEPGCCYVPVN